MDHLFWTGQWPNTPPGCVSAIWPRRVMKCCIRWPGSPQSPSLYPIEMVWDEYDRRVKEKQPIRAQHMLELLQDCCKSIPGEAGWENDSSAKLSSRQRLATLKNLKYKIYLDLFKTFLVTTWFLMCYLMSSLLFYNVENRKNKEKPLNE
jgi:hypothetical protein